MHGRICGTVRCPSVPARAHSSKPAAAGLLLWARRAGDIDRSLQQRRANAGSPTLSAYVGSWSQTCYSPRKNIFSYNWWESAKFHVYRQRGGQVPPRGRCPWAQRARGAKCLMTNVSLLKFDEWAKTSLSQRSLLLFVANLFRHYLDLFHCIAFYFQVPSPLQHTPV